MIPSLLRKLACSAAAVGLICFGACERHYPSELQAEEHVKPETVSKESRHETNEGAHKTGDQQQMSTTALTPTPSPTAAQFFPSATPH